uniref:antitoxin n=1 Tax=Pseudoduganella sp. OTU4001 TaxID=3043854 RepID=UPI00313B22FA
MSDIAKLFFTGRSQAVRLPKDYRFEGTEVFISRDPVTGDVILSKKPKGIERGISEAPRDPFSSEK